MRRDRPKLTALWHALDEAAFGSERTLNLRESLPSAADARARTEAWLRMRQFTKPDEVLIITGRGNQSAGGIGIIRKEIIAMMPSLRRRGIVENARDPLQRGERRVGPDLDELGPVPVPDRFDLRRIEIRDRLHRCEGRELKNRVGKGEQDKRQPNAFKARDATKAVAQDHA